MELRSKLLNSVKIKTQVLVRAYRVSVVGAVDNKLRKFGGQKRDSPQPIRQVPMTCSSAQLL